MGDCSNPNLTSKLECILTYGGSVYHSSINYTLVVLSILPAVQYPTTRRKSNALVALAFTIVFQISLCLFIVNCSGVSIIWCAIGGWLWTGHCYNYHGLSPTRPTIPAAVRVTLWLDACGILYYMVTFPFITTVAHVCAVGMGSILHYWAQPYSAYEPTAGTTTNNHISTIISQHQ